MKLTRQGTIAVVIAAAFFAGSVVTLAVAGDGPQVAKKKKKPKRGPAGPAGPTGPTGPRGPAGATNVVIRDSAIMSAPADGTPTGATANCNPGEVAVGGGLRWTGADSEGMRVVESYPITPPTPTAWTVVAENNVGDAMARNFTSRVICASP